MDFTNFDAALAKLGNDLSAEIAAAVAAITSAQSNPADAQHLADAVTALNNIDTIVNAATGQFAPNGTNTSTSTIVGTFTGTVPPPPVV